MTVDDYIQTAPTEFHERLRQLRSAILDVASAAEEKLSYGMPYYGYKGRLAYFALAKHHIGLYIPPPIIEQHKDELKVYVTLKATVQFPHDKELPLALVKKLVKARVMWNEEHEKK